MKKLTAIWAARSTAEKAVFGVVTAALLGVAVFGAIAALKRPADISNPDAAFVEEEEPAKPPDRSVDWPRFGNDRERTKFLDAGRVKPPFSKLWKYDQQELIEFAPIVVGNRLFMIDNDGVFIALDKDTGKVIWKKRLGKLNASSPAYYKGMLVAVSLEPGQALGVRARDGKVMWRRDLPGRAESSPMVVGGTAYFGTEPGIFFALNARNGKVEWQTQLDGAVKAAPAFSGGKLFVGDYAGQFYSIGAGNGKIRWKTSDLGAGLGRSGRFYSTPAVAFGRVYVGNVDGRVYSFDEKTGEIAWTFSAGDFVYSGIAAASGKRISPSVFFGSHDRNVYSLDAKSGKLNWKAPPGGQVSGPATVVGNVIYVSSFGGNSTTGFDTKTGRRVFKFGLGEYGPVVSDGERLYMMGGSEVVAFRPLQAEGKSYKEKGGTKGVVTPAEARRLRGKGKPKPAKAAGSGSSDGGGAPQGSKGKKAKRGAGRS